MTPCFRITSRRVRRRPAARRQKLPWRILSPTADSVLIPIQCEYFALEGLSQLTNTIKLVKRNYNPGLEIEGVLLTMYDGRQNLSIQSAEEVKKYFNDKLYTAVIPRNVRLSEAPSYGMPIFEYDRFCKGAMAYKAVGEEFLRKNAGEQP